MKKGTKHNELTKQKIRNIHLGKNLSEDHKQKIREAHNRLGTIPPSTKGKKLSKEHKQKISLSHLGKKHKPHSEETKQKMRLKIITDEMRKRASQISIANKSGYGNKNFYGHKHSDESKRKMSIALTGRKCSEQHKEKVRLANLGKTLSEEHKHNIGLSSIGRKHPHTEATKQIMRISALERFLKNGTAISIGMNETQLLDKQEQIDSCKIIRQFVIHPLGYVADGYCSETNTIYEVYEKYHNKPKNKDRDIKRQNAIMEHLHCKFIIMWDIK